MIAAFALAVLYLPTRLIQEANPEWRAVSWMLAIEVVVVTLACVRNLAPPGDGLGFAVGFFLVAVPWPTLIEAPLIKLLTRANAAMTVEALNLAGVPALQQGNVIEIGAGAVGIEEACSGIRSFQATLMLSLFFGEIYRLRRRRRLCLCGFGFGLALLGNLVRTGGLTWVAAQQGLAAIASWHDPAGLTILLMCFLGVWMAARLAAPTGSSASSLATSAIAAHPETSGAGVQRRRLPAVNRVLILGLWVWIPIADLATKLWYDTHETNLLQPIRWTVSLPRENPTFRELDFSPRTRELLRFSEAQQGCWQEGACRWQAIFLRWDPGRTAAHLAKAHTPASCLAAAGCRLLSESGVQRIYIKGLALPVRHYVFEGRPGRVHVFYCLWEDREPARTFGAELLNYQNRFAPVLAGRRNRGQRSLELALWGVADPDAAELALRQQLDRLVRL
jgi:exosortase